MGQSSEHAAPGCCLSAIENQTGNNDNKYNKGNRVAVNGCPDIHKHTGKSGHFRAELNENLIKYRHDLHKQDNDDNHHHACHDHRICNGIADVFADRIFSFVMILQGGHDLIQSTGFLANPNHIQHVGRVDFKGFHGLIQTSGLLHIFEESLENLFFLRRVRILQHNSKSFHGRDA